MQMIRGMKGGGGEGGRVKAFHDSLVKAAAITTFKIQEKYKESCASYSPATS